MSKKKKDKTIEEYEKLRNKIAMDKVDEIFRTQPDSYISMNLKISSVHSSPITRKPVWTRKIWIHSRN